MNTYTTWTCKICGIQQPSNEFAFAEIKICSRKCKRKAKQAGKLDRVQKRKPQTRETRTDNSARTDSSGMGIGKILIWFFFWPFKILFVLISIIRKHLLPLIWAILKFVFSTVKNLFIKATDQDGDGDVDLDDIKLILKKFTAEGRADSAERKLAKARKNQEDKEARKLQSQSDLERLAKANEEREKLKNLEK